MSKEDLIHLKEKGDPYSDSIRAKLVGTASEKRKQSAVIRGLKMANPETIEKRAMQLVANPKLSAVEIMKLIQTMLNKKGLNDNLRAKLIGTLIAGHLAIHGSKSKNINYNLDANQTIADLILKRLLNYKTFIKEKGREEANKILLETTGKENGNSKSI